MFLKDFPEEERRSFVENSLTSTRENFKESRNAAWELAKFLFAANSAASAGLFLMLRSDPGNGWLIAAFFVFVLGVGFVGTAYFVGSWHFATAANAILKLNIQIIDNQLPITSFAAEQEKIVKRWLGRLIPFFGTLSFSCLLLGAGLAVKPFCSSLTEKTQSNQPAKISNQAVEAAGINQSKSD